MTAVKYQDYLAAKVLDEGQIVNYRSLSRALKVHVNAAKEMLYEFYQAQNGRKSGSVHASYLVYGNRLLSSRTQLNGSNSHDDGDTIMQDDSLAFSSSLPENHSQDIPLVALMTFTLVTQERLQDVKSSYETINSIHIYSLEPGPLSNVHILSDCNQAVIASTAGEDPLESWKQYGTIHNPQAKRRSNRAPQVPLSTAQAPSTSAMKLSSSANPIPSKPLQSGSARSAEPNSKSASNQKSSTSSIFNSFPKRNKLEVADQPQTTRVSKADQRIEDEPMKDAPLQSDAEEEEVEEGGESGGLAHLDMTAAKEKAEASRKAKAEREATLLKMMEEDSEPESDNKDALAEDQSMAESPAAAPGSPTHEDGALDTAPTSGSASQEQPTETLTESQPQVTTDNGRRRGRRRIMKKKTTKDAEGYLVTKEEPVWESFSEDEVEPTAKSKPAFSTGQSSASSKAKKSSATSKAGQGNIMSFFGKR